MATVRSRWRRLMSSTWRRKLTASPTPSSRARAVNARMSLGRQPPPNPRPALRKRRPMRVSCPSASARVLTSAPAASQTSAIALMNEILVARKEFAATLTSSAVAGSVLMYGMPASSMGAYTSRRIPSARGEVTPATSRSGRSVSSTANPSRRNSGFQATSTSTPSGASPLSRAAMRGVVPTGTVDLPTIRQGLLRWGTSPSMTASTWRRSAASEPACCGVPTQTKWTSPKAAASLREVEKRRRPESRARVSTSSSPGSKKGGLPSVRALIFSASTSTPRTSCPMSAMHAACTAPRYPVPMTVRRMRISCQTNCSEWGMR
ncbi:hypothetical protein ADK53_01775 [Streptomyces sp. WM6373]|nr:hypothetical protein ADK53_01775 [Streptomyces sp. WM6373]